MLSKFDLRLELQLRRYQIEIYLEFLKEPDDD